MLKHDGRDVFGRAFLTPDGALAVAVAPRGGGRHVQVLRYDADLTSATAQALPANVFVEAVSALLDHGLQAAAVGDAAVGDAAASDGEKGAGA